MPTVRYQIRSEYGLADPGLYGAAEKDDPEALLEGVAMAGLVGLLRQLGDLAEFAAEIFHDLHEEVMATACRGHGLTLRLRQLEAEFPSIESSLVSQISLPNVLQNDGVEFHANIQTDRNLITSGDMPRFVMDSYEECRGPPRLFTLDKFDVAGAGACLKRYSDPSFFKTEMSKSSDSIETEDSPREKKPRKIKKKAFRLRKGETLESLLISSSKSQSPTENQAPIVRRVKLKSLKSQNSENNNNTRKIHHSILVGLIESQQKILLSNPEKDSCFKKEQNGIITKPESLVNDPSDYVELERETNGEVQKMNKIFPIQEQNDFSSESDKIETQKEKENEIRSLNQTKDKILGDSDELENFVDALNTIESETEAESEKKIHKPDPIININNNNNKEGLESSSSQKRLENEFDEANEEFFDNDDLMDVSSTSSWRSDGARQLDGPPVSRQNDYVIVHKSELSDLEDSKALSVNEAEQAHENLEDLPSVAEDHAEQINFPLKNQVEEPISNDSVEELEIPIINSEEIKISDEAWIEKESLVSNGEETKSTNESISGEDSKLEGAIEGHLVKEDLLVSNEKKNLRNESINETFNIEDSSVSKLEGAIEEQLVMEDSLVSNEEQNLRNESINETSNVQNSSVSNKEGKFILDGIISEGLEETNENHNEVSQVELKNISDEILNLEEYLISNRDYDSTIERNKSSNEKDESLLETDHSEKAQDDFTDTLQSDQKYKSDESLNHEDLISFREEETIPTYGETMNLPKHNDGLESEENADYLSGEKDERNFEETLIQQNENTLLFQEPKDYSHEPFSPNSQTDDCPEPVRALLDLGETLNPKQEEDYSLKTQETLNPKEEEENSLKTLDSFEEIQQQHEKDWQAYLFEEESKVDSVKQIQENEPIHYNFVNNFNLLSESESHERYSENPFETNTHLEENAQNLILWSDNEEEYETLVEEFNAGAKQEFPNSDFLWEPASPPRESTIEPLVTSLSQNGAPTVSMDQVHHEPEPDRFSDASNKSECESGLQYHSADQVHELLPNDSESKACENELLVESFDEKEEECVDSGLPSPTADQVHHELWEISDPPVDQVHELSGLSDPPVDQVHELSGLSDPPVNQVHELSGPSEPAMDQVYEPSGLSDPPVDQVHELSGPSDPAMDQVYEPSGLSDPSVDQVNEQFGPSDPPMGQVHNQSLLEDLDSKSNEPLTEKDWIEPGFFPTVSVGFNHEQSELSNETDISQSDELSTDKIVLSRNLGFDNNQSKEEKEENSDVKPHDFSRDSCTNEKPSINASINETDEKPSINALSTPFTDLDDTNPNPNSPSIDPNPNPSIPSIDPNPNPNSIDRDISDIFSSISQSSNTSSQNEDKPPPLPPLGWRLGGKLRKGISLPLNGFLPALKPDPFGELPCIDEPKQDDIGNNSNDLFKSINAPDPFVELPCIAEPKQDDIGSDLSLFKPVNEPDPFVEMPCVVEPKQDDIGSNSDPFVKPINVPDPFVEMPCVVETKQDNISNDSDLFKPDPFETRSESVSKSDSQKESEVLSNDCTVDLQKQEREREKEKPYVVSLFDLPPISNPNPQVDPLLGQNVQDFEHKAGPNPDPSTNVSLISNPNYQPNPISGQNVQTFEHNDPNPDPITILPTISNPNPPANPNLGQNLQTFETNGGSNPDPTTNLPQTSNPNPPPNPNVLAQNLQNFPNSDPNPPPIPNPNNPPPNPNFSSDPNPPNLFLPAGYLIPLEENLWARYGIGPAIEDERLGRRNKAYSIRNIPRNPLMDAVAAHDRSTMRKVSELVRPTDESKPDERNSLLEQIRNKSFSLRPVSTPKTTAVKAPQTNLKVAAIVEKANAIRQACVGSDEEDEDSWSDA